jgi:hypothetical protein
MAVLINLVKNHDVFFATGLGALLAGSVGKINFFYPGF